MSENKKICACGKLAVWLYAPDSQYFACDDCVPRGCSCNREPKFEFDHESPEAANPDNYYEPTDENGRKYPCCEWWYDEKGFEIRVTGADVLQADYEKSLTPTELTDNVAI